MTKKQHETEFLKLGYDIVILLGKKWFIDKHSSYCSLMYTDQKHTCPFGEITDQLIYRWNHWPTNIQSNLWTYVTAEPKRTIS